MFNGKYLKAVTFSYDDGVTSDARLIGIFNKYGIKGTFNLNSGVVNHWDYKATVATRMNLAENKYLYNGHEIAVHCLTHADLPQCDEETMRHEISDDKANLEALFGTAVHGMAYPYGTYNDRVVEEVRKNGLIYARTVEDSHSYDMQSDLLRYKPTCHHNDAALFDLAEEFIALKPDTPKLFYIWGHSYEFDGDCNWERIEDLCELIAGKDDICYCTNYEAFKDNI